MINSTRQKNTENSIGDVSRHISNGMKKINLYKIIGIIFIFLFSYLFFFGVTQAQDVVYVDAQGNPVASDGTYKLLAPIPGLTEASSDIGDYLNTIFKIAIGLCGALAVVMIIIGGVQYMGKDSVFGKTEARNRILAAVLGLLIALGSWALLNTVNPDLLGSGGLKIAQVKAEINPEVVDPSAPQVGACLGSIATVADPGKCPEGIIGVPTKCGALSTIYICNTAATKKLPNLLQAACNNNPSIAFAGRGYRTAAQQQCLWDNYKCSSPSGCTPNDVAPPGTSNHETGLAIDFTCNGVGFVNPTKRPDTKVCYDWLVTHANTYGFSNWPKESWHWSTNGK